MYLETIDVDKPNSIIYISKLANTMPNKSTLHGKQFENKPTFMLLEYKSLFCREIIWLIVWHFTVKDCYVMNRHIGKT